ncbi:hypothetical protein EDC04DRAFT_3136321 [Pisolithus marmoratus]|nr:hypothetical protein EDC04DRAFT_3136321 [Pisolithus marmoratus]
MRLNALYQVVCDMEGLQKYQFFLAAMIIIEFVVCGKLHLTLRHADLTRKIIEPPAGVPLPGCMLSESPSDTLILPGWPTPFGLTLHLLFSSMRWQLKSFRDFTISSMKEEIWSTQQTTLVLIRDGVLFYIPRCSLPQL